MLKIIIVDHVASAVIPYERQERTVAGNAIFPNRYSSIPRSLSQSDHREGFVNKYHHVNPGPFSLSNSWAAAHSAYNEPIEFEGDPCKQTVK